MEQYNFKKEIGAQRKESNKTPKGKRVKKGVPKRRKKLRRQRAKRTREEGKG